MVRKCKCVLKSKSCVEFSKLSVIMNDIKFLLLKSDVVVPTRMAECVLEETEKCIKVNWNADKWTKWHV